MPQAIDPVKLKAAAEHLDWVLHQYPDNEDVQGLYQALRLLIEDAKVERISEPIGRMGIPGAYNNADGRYVSHKHPDVGDAYANFVIEMTGGLTEKDKQRIASIEAIREVVQTESQS
jgi:hypothetical protein